MKKYIIFFILLSASGIIYLLVALHSENDFISTDDAKFHKEDFVSVDNTRFHKEDFVSMDNNKFKLDGKEFYPIAVNYLSILQTDGNDLWARPSIDYTIDTARESSTKESCLKDLRADMKLIKQMGFNAVRVVGIGEVQLNDSDRFSNLGLFVYKGHHQFASVKLNDTASYRKYFDALAGLFNEINNAGLKVILLLRIRPDVLTTEDFLAKITHYFKNDATILAYDLYNEPLYFDKAGRDKQEIYKITRRWKKICKRNSPRHLITMGLEGIREVHAWDPDIINVDFLSFHPYEHEPEQVRNEMYWYSKYVKKPWIIGETAIPADGDSVSYEDQKQFAHKTLKQAYDCGAIGYSWWQYKDVHWPQFHSSYMGVVNRKGVTVIGDDLEVNGTVKPVAEEFKAFDPTAKKDSCICLSNYYNYSQYHDCRIKGRLLDENNKPIEGGVILVWNQWWSHSYHTITRADGTFEVLGNFPFYHWIASACGYSMVRADVSPDHAKKETDNIPTINIGDLKIKKLSFYY